MTFKFILLLLVAAMGSTLGAQAAPGSVQVGLDYGRWDPGSFANGTTVFDHEVALRSSRFRGADVATQFTDEWGLELSVRGATSTFTPATWQGVPNTAWFEYGVIEVSAVRSYQTKAFAPYWLVGMGIANLNFNVPDPAYRDTNRTSFCAGGGARYWLAPWAALRLDARAHAAYLQARRPPLDGGWSDPGRWWRTSELVVGIQFSFGPNPRP